jgi:hypothetical protein
LDQAAKGGFVPAMSMARLHARLKHSDTSLKWLRRALHEPSRLVLELPLDRTFHALRNRPDFTAIVAALPNALAIHTFTKKVASITVPR